MNAVEFRRWPTAQGCRFESHRGGSGHLTMWLGDRKSQLPIPGSRRKFGRGLIAKVKKDLGLK